jgi:uncharacterized protein (DUF302 family)
MQIASFAGFARLAAAFAVAALASVSHAQGAGPADDGLVKVRSAYTFDETVERLKRDIASKGIRFFLSVDQSKLAADAGIALRPSTLLIFGNPPLGAQFLTANAYSGLDWPVRLLVLQDEAGAVWTAYTDFGWIARRHGITNRAQQFDTASMVIDSITSSVKNR